MHTHESLTSQEASSQQLATIDLAAGYPRLATRHRAAILRLLPASPPRNAYDNIDASLSLAVNRFLDPTRRGALHCLPTFSGSIAIQRAFETFRVDAMRRGATRIQAIVQTPTLDVIFSLAKELTRTEPIQIPLGPTYTGIDASCDAFTATLRRLSKLRRDTKYILTICSPNNPDGFVWPREKLQDVAQVCAERDISLVVDHCFLTAGVHNQSEIATIWQIQVTGCRWLAIWDTGKTFDIAGEKLAFLLSDNESTVSMARNALQVIQLDQPIRLKLLVQKLLSNGLGQLLVLHLHSLCKKNYAQLAQLQFSDARLLPLQAGSLALVDVTDCALTASELRSALLRLGLGLVHGQPFFGFGKSSPQLLRLALARKPTYFKSAVSTIKSVLS